jgi:hypothetical protein
VSSSAPPPTGPDAAAARRSRLGWRRWRALGDVNATLDKCDRVTIDSIRNHTARHFPVQNAAKATYREILERRAKENAVDFVEGVPPRSPHWPSLKPSW